MSAAQRQDTNFPVECSEGRLRSFWHTLQELRTTPSSPGKESRRPGRPATEGRPPGAPVTPHSPLTDTAVAQAKQAFEDGRAFVQRHLRPWASRWRARKGEEAWNRIRDEDTTVLLIEHLRGRLRHDIIRRLETAQISCADSWASLQLQVPWKRRGIGQSNITARVEVLVDDNVRHLLIGERALAEACEPAVRVSALPTGAACSG